MRTKISLGSVIVVFGLISWSQGADESGRASLTLTTEQKEFLTFEPILVKIRLKSPNSHLPIQVGDAKGKIILRFDIQPPVKTRPGAKPLPLESQRPDAQVRIVDLLEWYQFPGEGKFRVEAMLEQGGEKLNSATTQIELRRPGKDDLEWGPVDRLHHMPWSNYIADAFCGDTFDVVKRWPKSRLTPYCTYYNGLHHLHKKEYDQAIASLQTVVKHYPKFVLTPDAQWAIAECLRAQGKLSEAEAQVKACEASYPDRFK